MAQISVKYKKDFAVNDYSNPIKAKDKKRKYKVKQKYLLIASLVLLILLGYVLYFSPFFKIKNIQVNGLERISRDSIMQIVDNYRYKNKWLIFSKNNYWNFDSGEVRDRILNEYWLDDLRVEKKFRNEVIISLREKPSSLNWLTNNICFSLDPTGLAVEYCQPDSGKDIQIKDLKNKQLALGKTAINKQDLRKIFTLHEFLSGSEQFGDILQYELLQPSITVFVATGPELRFDLTDSIEAQMARLMILTRQPDIQENLAFLKYIDLRFGEKVNYK